MSSCSLTLYYNPRCGKCREAKALLDETGEDVRIVEYLDMPPDEATLRDLLQKLGIPARDLLRDHDPLYRELGMDNPGLSDDDIVRALVENPQLMHRPILVKGSRAVIGRPPQKVLELL